MATAARPITEDMRPILEEVRKDLLDFGMRNPLLNYRLLKSRGTESVPTDAVRVFQSLVTDSQQLEFVSANRMRKREQLLLANEESGSSTETAWRELSPEQQALWANGDVLEGTFASIHAEKDLESRLLATFYSARSSVEEQGVNTLFVALGMLSWNDLAAPEDNHRAPLLLIPVELSRESASEGFRLRYSGDDVSPNLCLIEFLKQFGIVLDPGSETEEFDTERYFDRFDAAISANPTWSIDRESVVIGFFSFSKFLMYRDLDPTTWPEADALLKHGLLSKLLGQGSFAGEGSSLSENSHLDEHLSSNKCFHVVDADSSQTLALLDVASGTSMVIQGPPGTGKSQTIINLIAEALASKKRVLFVSEKQAALDVVKKRLDKIGLGNPCLELHSNKAKKKEVIDELKRTAGLDLLISQPRSVDEAALSATRDELNDYCEAVNRPVGASQERPIDLFGVILPAIARLSTVENPLIDLPAALKWNEIETQRKRDLIKSLQQRLHSTGIPEAHPFWGSSIRVVLPATRDRLRQACKQCDDAATRLEQHGQTLAALLGTEQPMTPADISHLCRLATRLLDFPQLQGLDLENEIWVKQQSTILKTIKAGKELASIRAQWASQLKPSAWSVDTVPLRSDIQALGGKWWRFLSPRWKSTIQQVKALLVATASSSVSEYLAVTNAIQEAYIADRILSEHEPILVQAYGRHWRGSASNWESLESQFETIVAVGGEIERGSLPNWCSVFLTGTSDRVATRNALRATEEALIDLASNRQAIIEVLKFTNESIGIAGLTNPNQALVTIQESWRSLASYTNTLDSLVSYLLVREECLGEGLEALTEIADRWLSGPTHLLDVFDYARTSCLLTSVFEQSPSLVHFDQKTHSDLVERFRQLDDKALSWARAKVSSAHHEGMPKSNSGNGQLGYLYTMFERRTKFPPIRKLMSNAGLAIQALKPVFMMSPLSVANFLPPSAVTFDLVIFDEASQVRPADALGAIVRATQAVVVGDSKQLPPSSFFDSLAASDDDDDGIATKDIESILGLFCSRGAHQRMLRWHYRSKHESLIEGSNYLFYKTLVVFPSPDQRRENLGLIYNKIANAPYERSKTKTNPTEARIIAEAVMKHATEQLKRNPLDRLTLGVAAFSVAQRDAILDQLEIARRIHPGLEEFFATPPHEPFFVKNLENIQGDERDVIFISVGYGRTAEGYLAMGFGPVNRDGGERRLNVLFTRARIRCEVFTTLSADDIELSPTSGSGLKAFKHFLQYAEHGRLGVATPVGRPPDSPFEEEVIETLERLGYEVHPQVGCAGFFIDMAVTDPNQPGRYLIGIECDGAAYHSARSARDRDRLREGVLRGLGWRLHRIWSTAWFKSRDREIERLISAIQLAQAAPSDARDVPKSYAQPVDPAIDVFSEEITAASQPIRKASGSAAQPYEFCRLNISIGSIDLHLVPTAQLVEWLAQVVAVESPVHWAEAGRRITESLGVQRMGNRIQDALGRACKAGSRSKKFRYKDDFLFSVSQEQSPIRDRSEFPAQTKKLEYVSPSEICAAVEHVVREGFGMPADDIPIAVCRLLGFSRVSEEMRSVVSGCRDSLVSEGRLRQHSDMLIVAS